MLIQLLLFNSIFVSTFQTPRLSAIIHNPFKDIGSRIINGEDAEDGEFPWQVAIIGSSTSIPRYLCGGALISEEWILTAGHCVNGAKSAEIYSGSTKISSRNKTISKAAEFILHEDYDGISFNNDIGLIRLEKPIEINNFTKPIALAEDELQPNTIVKVSGWGMVSDDDPNPYSDSLKFINVSTIANLDCQYIFGTITVYPGLVCTTTGVGSVKSPCLGDSGAPVVADINNKPVHVAIFSFVNSLGCEFPYPAGNSRTAFFRNWIKKHSGI